MDYYDRLSKTQKDAFARSHVSLSRLMPMRRGNCLTDERATFADLAVRLDERYENSILCHELPNRKINPLSDQLVACNSAAYAFLQMRYRAVEVDQM